MIYILIPGKHLRKQDKKYELASDQIQPEFASFHFSFILQCTVLGK